jgi:pimeloyl-ACP methyl ester carboxylesterase
MLREAGHTVYTPTLTGLGERSHLTSPGINLDTHVQDILNVFKYEDITDAVLCGHSYGGMVITGVANEIGERIRSLVYIDAYAPADGQSLMDITGPETALAFLAQAGESGGMIPPIPASIFNVNAADAAWVDALSVPQPLATFVQAARGGVDSAAVSAVNRSFLFATANGGDWFASTHAQLKDHPEWQVHEIACGHSIMLDRPGELMSLLLAEAGRARKPR